MRMELPRARMSRVTLWGGIAITLALILLPAWLSSPSIGLLTEALIAALFAMAFNLLYGQAGMLSFGQSAYYGIGMFAAIHVMRAAEANIITIPTPLIPLIGGLVAMVVGYLVGLLATRRTGVYFALITVAFSEIMLSIATPFDFLFGGEGGLSSWRGAWMGLTFDSTAQVYYLVLFWVVLSIAIMRYLIGTPLGRASEAIRENDERLSFLGFDVHHTKTIIFALSSMFSGIAGALMALDRESATYLVFGLDISAEVVLNALIGGIGVFLGPAVGGVVMTIAGSVVSDISRSWSLYQGFIFVLLVMFLPQGLAGLAKGQWEAVHRYGVRRLLAPWILFLSGTALTAASVIITVEVAHDAFDASISPLSFQGASGPKGVEVFWLNWGQTSATTWLVVLVAFGLGIMLLRKGWARAGDLAKKSSLEG